MWEVYKTAKVLKQMKGLTSLLREIQIKITRIHFHLLDWQKSKFYKFYGEAVRKLALTHCWLEL